MSPYPSCACTAPRQPFLGVTGDTDAPLVSPVFEFRKSTYLVRTTLSCWASSQSFIPADLYFLPSPLCNVIVLLLDKDLWFLSWQSSLYIVPLNSIQLKLLHRATRSLQQD
ncbi:hypothetical protein BT93_B2254 [Corymbia citriodora subsp. variegata]|nr:hypothetical protein BT93_B2254 [Corymbia citriodora subsp. variegata]